jgi:putative ABC transport system permease protein
MANLARRILGIIRRRQLLDELAEELETHRAMHQQALERDGMPAAEAAAASRRVMGNATLAHEDARDVWRIAALDHLRRDLTYAMRTLRREPTFALAAGITLAVGIATVTGVFSIVDAELWKPLPFPNPDRLVEIRRAAPGQSGWAEQISGADLRDWQAQSRSFTSLAGYRWTTRHVLQRETAESVSVIAVTASFFSTLGVSPALGRPFTADDARRGRVALLTDQGWRRLFNADPGVIGRTIVLDGQHTTVVGIMAARDLEVFGQPDDFLAAIDETSAEFLDRSSRDLSVIGRLGPDVGMAGAQAELQAIDARLAPSEPQQARTIRLWTLREDSARGNWRPLYFFLGAALIVLVLSCVNVANLLLARALRRQREFAIRGALGGGRSALIRQLLVEGTLLAVPSAAAGVLIARWTVTIAAVSIPEEYLQPGRTIPLDARVLMFALALTALTAFVFGLVPALFARRVNLNVTLGQGGRTAGAAPRQARTRHVLLTVQVAVTLVLVAGAGLFLQSFIALTRVPLGFHPENRLSLRVVLSGPRYSDDAPVRRYAGQLLERARAVPGVIEAAIGSSSPLMSGQVVRFVRPDHPRPASGEEPRAIIRAVSPGFFKTLGIPVAAGREFADTDASGAPRVVVINAYLARQLFPGENPIGRTIELVDRQRTPWTERPGTLLVVGVASNVKEVGLNEVEFNDIYVPFAQMPAPFVELVAHTGVAPSAVAPVLRAAAADLDPSLPVSAIATLDQRVNDALKGDWFNLMLIGSFAAIAILLAAVGIYGAVAYAVEERTREFGVRLALGARPRAIVLSALGQAVRFGIAGGAIGLAATLIAARLIGNALYLVRGEHNGVLYGVTTTDPRALSAAFVAIVAVAVLSGLVPARHVSRLDPLLALREE